MNRYTRFPERARLELDSGVEIEVIHLDDGRASLVVRDETSGRLHIAMPVLTNHDRKTLIESLMTVNELSDSTPASPS